MAGMQIIDPTYIDDAKLISSDIPEVEAGYPEWDPTYSYVTGQRVVVTDTGIHNIYEATWGTANLNKYPPSNLAGTPVFWSRRSKTNRWKLFDLIVAPDRSTMGTNVTGAVWASGVKWQPNTSWSTDSFSSMQATVAPGVAIDTVAIMNVDCTSISLIMTDHSAGEVYNEVKIPTVNTAFNAIYSGLPAYANATLQVTIKNQSGAVSAGEIIVGKARTIGTARHGVGVGLVDYSAKSVDAFGNFSILERAFSKRVDCSFMMPVLTHAGILRLLEKYRSVPLVWIISNLYSTTVVYGFYRDLKVSIPNMNIAEGSLSIEGLGADYVHATPIPDPWVDPWDGKIHLTVPMVLTVAVSTSKIEEAPVAPSAIALTVPSVPTLAVSTTVFNLADTDGVCTISHASPAVVTCSGHGLADDQEILFQTTGALPAPLVAGTHYFVVAIDLDTFSVSLTAPGSTIDTTTDGSGTHKVLGKA